MHVSVDFALPFILILKAFVLQKKKNAWMITPLAVKCWSTADEQGSVAHRREESSDMGQVVTGGPKHNSWEALVLKARHWAHPGTRRSILKFRDNGFLEFFLKSFIK